MFMSDWRIMFCKNWQIPGPSIPMISGRNSASERTWFASGPTKKSNLELERLPSAMRWSVHQEVCNLWMENSLANRTQSWDSRSSIPLWSSAQLKAVGWIPSLPEDSEGTLSHPSLQFLISDSKGVRITAMCSSLALQLLLIAHPS